MEVIVVVLCVCVCMLLCVALSQIYQKILWLPLTFDELVEKSEEYWLCFLSFNLGSRVLLLKILLQCQHTKEF